jgi:hypothetical protein
MDLYNMAPYSIIVSLKKLKKRFVLPMLHTIFKRMVFSGLSWASQG